jgi:DNA-binding NarL/FixJ family response regulator
MHAGQLFMALLKVLVVDDHPVFREGLVRVLNQERDLTVCGEAADASEALKLLGTLKPDLIIVDISLEGMNGIDLIKSIRTQQPRLAILVLSMHKESLYAERALRAGANGYLMKRESGQKLLGAIRQVLRGQTYASDDFKEHILRGAMGTKESLKSSPMERLSDRELEVFQRIGQGYGTRQIAEELNLSMKTIETYREHLREKLSLKSTFELVQYAIGWVHR